MSRIPTVAFQQRSFLSGWGTRNPFGEDPWARLVLGTGQLGSGLRAMPGGQGAVVIYWLRTSEKLAGLLKADRSAISDHGFLCAAAQLLGMCARCWHRKALEKGVTDAREEGWGRGICTMRR